MQVVPNSPAAKAGLEDGDVITAIDGRAALEWTPDQLQALFEDGDIGRVVRIDSRRAGHTRSLKVKLAELL